MYITHRALYTQVHIKNCALLAEFPYLGTRRLLRVHFYLRFLKRYERGRYVEMLGV